MRNVKRLYMPISRTLAFLLFAILHSIKINAQAISTIPARNILLPQEAVPEIKRTLMSDSLRNRPFTYRDNRIPQPLFIVDGKPIQEQDLKLINPNDIDKIEVLKDIAATAIYGSRGANGVMLMTLKHPQTKPLPQPITKKGRLD